MGDDDFPLDTAFGYKGVVVCSRTGVFECSLWRRLYIELPDGFVQRVTEPIQIIPQHHQSPAPAGDGDVKHWVATECRPAAEQVRPTEYDSLSQQGQRSMICHSKPFACATVWARFTVSYLHILLYDALQGGGGRVGI